MLRLGDPAVGVRLDTGDLVADSVHGGFAGSCLNVLRARGWPILPIAGDSALGFLDASVHAVRQRLRQAAYISEKALDGSKFRPHGGHS